MPIHLVCECGARVIAPIKRAGQSIRCPKCDARIPVPGGEGEKPGSFSSSATRPSRIEDAISDLISARKNDAPAPRRNDRIDPPQEKTRPPVSAPSGLPAPAKVLAPVTKAPTFNPPPTTAEKPLATPAVARVDGGPKRGLPAEPVFPSSGSPISAPVVSAPTLTTLANVSRPAATMITIALDEDSSKALSAPAIGEAPKITRPIQIVTTTRAVRGDKGWLGAVYGLALLWSVLAMVGIAIAALESYFYFRAEELWRLERWSFLVLGASVIQLALAVYLVQMADWIACRAAAVVISCIAAAEAMILAVTLFSTRDGWFAKFMDLAPHMQTSRAIGVTLLLTLLSVLLAYTTASVSLSWQRYEERGLGKRAAG